MPAIRDLTAASAPELLSGEIPVAVIDAVDGVPKTKRAEFATLAAALGGSTAEFTAAELAALDAEAADYSDGVTRRPLGLHQPTTGVVLWIAYGQSLSNGWEAWPALTSTTPPDCYMLGQSVHPAQEANATWAPVGGSAALQPLVATVKSGTGILDAAAQAALSPGDTNQGETPLEGFAAQLRPAWLRARGTPDGDPTNKWVFASCGVGGRTIAELSPGASPERFNRIRGAIAYAKAEAVAAGATFSVGGMIYVQGEADYGDGTSLATYATALGDLIDAVRAEAEAEGDQNGTLPVFLMQTGGTSANDSQELAIARAQLQVAQTVPGVFIVSSNQVFPDKGVHLTSNGSRWMGHLAGKVAAKALVDGEGWECTRAIRWTYRGQTVVGLFHAPVAPLRFATSYTQRAAYSLGTARGIHVEDGGGALTVTSCQISGRQLVVLTVDRAITGTCKVWLGRKATFNGGIAVADSDRTRMALPYAYTAGSGQYADEDIAALVGLTYPAANFALADVQTATAAT